MKKIFNTVLCALAALVMTGTFTSCHEADAEYVHTDNLIQQLFIITDNTKTATKMPFTITEYNAKQEVVPVEDIKDISEVAGGYGIATIEIPLAQSDDIDLTKIYLWAEVGYDVIITPGLVGQHDITGEGITIYAKAGSGAIRPYRVVGSYK